MADSEIIKPEMIDSNRFFASSDGDELKPTMTSPLKKAEDEDRLLSEDGQEGPKRYESGERPATIAEVEEATGSRTQLQETLLDATESGAIREFTDRVLIEPGDEEIEDEWIDPLRHIEDKLTAIYESGEYPHIIRSEGHLRHMIALMSGFSDMFRGGTLKDHLDLTEALKKEGYIADDRYDQIHRDKSLSFSQFENAKPNDFVKHLVATGRIKAGALIAELGPGGGEDARHIAANVPGSRVVGVDISMHAVEAATRITEQRGLADRVRFKHGNFMKWLRKFRRQPFDGIYMHSSGQYRPPRVQEQIVFKLIADVLRETRGELYLAMKIGASDSAHSPLQIELDVNSPDNPKIDLRHKVYRGYPRAEEDVHNLLTPSGLVVKESQIVPYFGYDRSKEMEYVCQLAARPE